jgi:hypothetical protein
MPTDKPGKAKKSKETGGREAIRIRWERKNVGLFGGGLVAVAIGYLLLSQGDITLAPILLVVGYCVLIPLAFIL